MVSDKNKILIQRIINVFETGIPEGKYDALVIFNDGKGGSRQITYGRSQTTEQGNLKKLIQMYISNNGQFADGFAPYMNKIGVVSLVDDDKFKRLLRKSAREDPIMLETQDMFFDKAYWNKAQNWFENNGFQEPLSMLVAYDSFIHSGSVPMLLRKRFIESPPSNGGDERKWTSSYVETRHQWLKHHSKKILRKTIYRTETFLNEIERSNWKLSKLPIIANGTPVS